MFRGHYVMVVNDGSRIDKMMMLASNHKLYCTYKIGVYGEERQHELFLTGSYFNYRAFLNSVKKTFEEKEQ